jgi:hypothetical protein
MLLSPRFARFAAESPVSVMVRGVLEPGLAPEPLDRLVAATARTQSTTELLFSTLVDRRGLVVGRIRPSRHAAGPARAEPLPVSLQALDAKRGRLEPEVSAALVRHTAAQLKELRALRAGARPAQALVVLDPARMRVVDVFPDEDGPAQERASLPDVLASVRPGALWVADRTFCTTDFLFGRAARGACFLIRPHQASWHGPGRGEPCGRGRSATGTVSVRTGRLADAAGGELLIRRIALVRDQPTRDGDAEIHLLSNVPIADAGTLAELSRRRWTLETAFQELTCQLACEGNTRGDPKAARFGFCVAGVASNTLAVVKAALRSVPGVAPVQEEVSGSSRADEGAGTSRGMRIAIPALDWEVFRTVSLPGLAAWLPELAGRVRLARFRQHPRGPQQPPSQRPRAGKSKHVATARLLAKRKKQT